MIMSIEHQTDYNIVGNTIGSNKIAIKKIHNENIWNPESIQTNDSVLNYKFKNITKY